MTGPQGLAADGTPAPSRADQALRGPPAGPAAIDITMPVTYAGPRNLRRLLDAVLMIGTDLDLQAMLQRIVEAADRSRS